MQYSDRPIFRPDQDLLRRKNFALQLARRIDDLSIAKDGFVIGLLGAWGEGKSSVVELLVRYLLHIEMERASKEPLIGESAAIEMSLEQLEAAARDIEEIKWRIDDLLTKNDDATKWDKAFRWATLRRWIDDDTRAHNANRYWRIKSKVLNRQKTSVVRFSPWLVAGRAQLATALLSDLARSLGDALGDTVRSAFASLLKRLSDVAPLIAAGANAVSTGTVGSVVQAGGLFTKSLGDRLSVGPTLDEVRDRLHRVLRKLDDRRILIIVDDLDRLTPPEALEMVALVKSLGDLPNVIYLLCYDEVKLEQLIHRAAKIDGREYLGKIVQFSVNLPRIDQADLSRLFDADLNQLLEPLSSADQQRLKSTWFYVFQHYLVTPREVRRLVNVVAVAVASARDRLNLVDILFLETLRLYEPEVYRSVRQNLFDLVD